MPTRARHPHVDASVPGVLPCGGFWRRLTQKARSSRYATAERRRDCRHHEYPLRVAPGVSSLQIKAASAAAALADAGLRWSDVDAVYDTGGDQNIGGLGISEYFGFKPSVIDTTYVGGSSFEFQANHALAMIAAGKCRVALLTYGSTAHSDRRAIGTAGARYGAGHIHQQYGRPPGG